MIIIGVIRRHAPVKGRGLRSNRSNNGPLLEWNKLDGAFVKSPDGDRRKSEGEGSIPSCPTLWGGSVKWLARWLVRNAREILLNFLFDNNGVMIYNGICLVEVE